MPKANPKSKMHQWTARVRVTRDETWTVEARTEEEAVEKFEAGDTVDEMSVQTTDWDLDRKSVKDEGEG